MRISFIIPAKNVESYIMDAIKGVLSQPFEDWELIAVDDGSVDKTYSVLLSYAQKDPRIKPVKNPYIGKVTGLNYGYSLSKGDFIKCIDGDDFLMPDFGVNINKIVDSEASYHDFEISNANLGKVSLARMSANIRDIDFESCFKNMMSIPRCLWSFKRSVADKIFPMPEDLPFEDVWFSLVIKKNASSVRYIGKSLYKYRQHDKQTYGGYYNYSKEKVVFRANRMIKLLDVIESVSDEAFGEPKEKLFNIKKFYNLLAQDKLSLRQILSSGLDAEKKTKLLLMRKISRAAALALRIKNAIGR